MKYYILIPQSGNVGTRNPTKSYDMMSSQDENFMKTILRKRKKENYDRYKKAFLVKI